MARAATKQTPKKKALPTRGAATRANVWRGVFLAGLADTCNVTHSARLAGIDRATAYKHRADDAEFATAWDDAIEQGIEALELAVRERAKSTSDTLAIFLLKAHRPERYRELKEVQQSGTVRVIVERKDRPIDPGTG